MHRKVPVRFGGGLRGVLDERRCQPTLCFEREPLPTSAVPVSPFEAAERFIAATGADIRHGGSRAFYRHTEDYIQMPERERFLGTATSSATESYYATLLHELTHWSGHDKRCARPFGERFGDNAYSMEELVALSGQSGCGLSGQSEATRGVF